MLGWVFKKLKIVRNSFSLFSTIEGKMLASFYFCVFFLSAAVQISKCQSPYETWCEDNNVPDGLMFQWPGFCGWFVACENGGTREGACEPEGTWFFPGPENAAPGSCDWPTDDDECDDTPLVWPQCLRDGVEFLPSVFCDTFYICV